jgi:DNA-binding transcriptional MerR regulator
MLNLKLWTQQALAARLGVSGQRLAYWIRMEAVPRPTHGLTSRKYYTDAEVEAIVQKVGETYELEVQ